MTGFGRATAESSTKRFTVEIKSLNSKQLDLNMRVPAAYREKELDIRNIIASQAERGKIDFALYVESLSGAAGATLNLDVLRSYKEQLSAIADDLGVDLPADWFSVLLRMPDVTRTDAPERVSDEDSEALMNAVEEAVAGLMEFRRKEGVRLEDFFRLRIKRIGEFLLEVPKHEVERVAKIRARIEESLQKLPQVDLNQNRLEQEMIFYIEKLDVNEERQRLGQHLNYFIETLEGNRGQGKKLGFIAQEMGREINTLGSKSNHAEMQKLVVRMKDELEQIKEQVLNVM